VASIGVMEYWSVKVVTKLKHHIPNKSQTPIFNEQNRFGIFKIDHWDLFGNCALLFGIYRYTKEQ
jgi:hypothetical protein